MQKHVESYNTYFEREKYIFDYKVYFLVFLFGLPEVSPLFSVTADFLDAGSSSGSSSSEAGLLRESSVSFILFSVFSSSAA